MEGLCNGGGGERERGECKRTVEMEGRCGRERGVCRETAVGRTD